MSMSVNVYQTFTSHSNCRSFALGDNMADVVAGSLPRLRDGARELCSLARTLRCYRLCRRLATFDHVALNFHLRYKNLVALSLLIKFL